MSNKEKYLDKRVIRTRKMIKEAFISLLPQKSYHRISIKDIVNEGKVSRVTFYNHYKDKEDLLDEIMNEVVSETLHSFHQSYQRLKHIRLIDIEPAATAFFENVYRYSHFYTAIVHSDILPAFQNRLISAFKVYELGTYNKKINHTLYAGYQAYAITGLIIEWVKTDFKYSPKYMSEQLLEILTSPPTQNLYRKH